MTLLLCLTLASATSFAQGTSPTPSVDKNKVIGRLLKEIDAGRASIAASETRVAALEAEVAATNAARVAISEAKDKALVEIGELRATIRFEKQALAERERQVEDLRGQRDTARAERDQAQAENKSLRKENLTLKGVLVAGLAAVVYVLAK